VVSKALSAVAGVTALLLVTLGALIAGPASAAAPASHAVLTYRYVPTGADLARSPASTVSAVSPAVSDHGCPNPFTIGDLPCVIPPSHNCIQVANDSSGAAIFCVDLMVGLAPGSTTTVHVWLRISGYCQDAIGYRACLQVVARGVTADPTHNPGNWTWEKICSANSPTYSPCAAHDRNYFSHDYLTLRSGTADEIWGVLWARTSIELPSQNFGFIQSNFETGHWVITNNLH
jgi:hypothetical protein